MADIKDILTYLKTEQKERCEKEIEERGGSHSWWKQCCKEKNHEGRCESYIGISQMIHIGTARLNIEQEISARQKKILSLQQEMLAIMIEIEMIEKATKK